MSLACFSGFCVNILGMAFVWRRAKESQQLFWLKEFAALAEADDAHPRWP